MESINWDDQDITDNEIMAAIQSLREGVGAKGKNISEVEDMFCKRLRCRHAILVSNCTTALITSMMAVKKYHPEIKRIAVPSFTFIASANTAQLVFGDVDLVDCSPTDWNVRPQDLRGNVDAVMLVDVGGVPCDYDEFKKLGIPIIADSAESLGSTYKGDQIGIQCDIHCFSFQRSKIITCGEGGLITTNDDKLAETCRSIISHGYTSKKKSYEYVHTEFGLNFRMCDVEAAILKEQLKKLYRYVYRRNQIANRYDLKLQCYFQTQKIPRYCTSNYFFYGIIVPADCRNQMAEYLIDNGIQVKCWTAIHQQKLWKEPRWDNELKNAGFISDGIILLPIHNTLTDNDVDYIIEKCKSFYEEFIV